MGRSFENHVIGGNVGGTPETSTLDSGATVCKFSVATNRKYKDKEYTTWYTVEAWSKLGEICQQYVQKGDFVTIIADRLSGHAFIGNDGEPKISIQLTARDVKFGGQARSEREQPDEDSDSPNAGDIPW